MPVPGLCVFLHQWGVRVVPMARAKAHDRDDSRGVPRTPVRVTGRGAARWADALYHIPLTYDRRAALPP